MGDVRACLLCDAEFTGPPSKRYCSKLCRKRAENRRLTRRKILVPCTYCGTEVEKHVDSARSRRFCSYLCRDLWRLETGTNLPPVSQPRSCPLPRDHPARWVNTATPIIYGHCPECGHLHISPTANPRTYCSPRCRSRAHSKRHQPQRRQRQAARRTAVLDRDNWTCWLCGHPINRTATVPAPDAPTIDHLIPLVDGGTNDPDNLAAAHFLCNSTRGRSLNDLTGAHHSQ